MLKFISTFIASATIAGAVSAACTGPGVEVLLTEHELATVQAQAQAMPYSEGIFWQADKGDKTLFLAGTMHIFDPRLLDLATAMQPQLEQADLLMLELTPEDEVAAEQQMMGNADLILLPEGKIMPEILSPEKWQAVADELAKLGIAPDDVAHLQPWVLSAGVMLPPCVMTSIQAGEPGFEELLVEALPEGTPIAALENWQDAIGFLTDLPIETQADDLLVNLAALPYAEITSVTTVENYFEGAPMASLPLVEVMDKFIPEHLKSESDDFVDRFSTTLLTDRNANWIPVIEEATTQHDTIFVAFGALHLGGELGVLNLLEQNGWDITQLPI